MWIFAFIIEKSYKKSEINKKEFFHSWDATAAINSTDVTAGAE